MNNQVPIVLFVMHMPPPVHGASMMGKYIHDSELINLEFNCHYINLTTASKLEDIGTMSISKIWYFVHLIKLIWDKVREVTPDLVYVTPNAKGGAFYKDFIVVEFLKLMGCKVVVHYHNKGVSTKQDCWVYNQSYRRFFKGIDVILLGKSLHKDVEKYVGRNHVYLCPNGIPVGELFKKDNAKISNDIPVLLFLGNLIESKGVIVFLDALKILKDKGCVFMCNFVGGETADIDVERFNNEVAARGLQDVTWYLGKKFDKEKEDAYRQSDIFVFPTYYENECFPLVLLEAMEHGLPCISTSEGAITDIIEDGVNGLIVERRNSYSLADKIEMLLNDKERRVKMSKEAERTFFEKFTLAIFEKRMCEILNQLLEKQ